MAKAEVKMPDEFLARISRLGAQTDSIAERYCRQAARLLWIRFGATFPLLLVSEIKANPALLANWNALSAYLPLWLTKR